MAFFSLPNQARGNPFLSNTPNRRPTSSRGTQFLRPETAAFQKRRNDQFQLDLQSPQIRMLMQLMQQSPQGFQGLQDSLLKILGDKGGANIDQLRGEQGSILDAFRGREGTIGAGHDERRRLALERLTGLGEQGRKDISQSTRDSLAGIQGRLTASGLGGTSIGGSLRRGVAREATDANARLNEQLRREQLQVELGTSGDKLSSQERLSGQTLTTRQQQSTQLFNALQQLLQGEIGIRGDLGSQGIGNQQQLMMALIQALGG